MSLWSRLRGFLGGKSDSSPEGDSASENRRAGGDTDGPAPVPKIDLVLGSATEDAARLRIAQVERALRGAGEREGESSAAEPPWARGKNRPGRLPSGPGRPPDAMFVLTVVLGSELPNDAAALSALLDSPLLHKPSVRLIPLVRNAQPEPGFSAEIRASGASGNDGRRAFLMYRPLPYGEFGGAAHVGLFVGGAHSPRVAIARGDKTLATLLGPDGEVAILSALSRSLLSAQPDALGIVLNRAGKSIKPRQIALSQLGPQEAVEERVPFAFWIDWHQGERGCGRCLISSGMEWLGLPDIAVALAGITDPGRGRDVLLYAAQRLVEGGTLEGTWGVPRRLHLEPGSRVVAEDSYDVEIYQAVSHGDDWIELVPAAGG